MATAFAPSSRKRARRRCSSGASGVVRGPVSVPIVAADHPFAAKIDARNATVVVLPFVPVTPTIVIALDG